MNIFKDKKEGPKATIKLGDVINREKPPPKVGVAGCSIPPKHLGGSDPPCFPEPGVAGGVRKGNRFGRPVGRVGGAKRPQGGEDPRWGRTGVVGLPTQVKG